MKLFIIIGSTVIFLIVMINLFVTLVIFLAEDEHVPDYVKIYEIFESSRYQDIRDKLMRHNYTILIGDDETGVKNFIEHQANIHTAQGRPVTIKRYHSISKQKQKLLKTIKETRFYMEFVLGLGRKEKTEVFFIKSAQELPLEEIKFIRQKYPNDNIIVSCQKNLAIKVHAILSKIPGFKIIQFPGVTLKQLKQMIRVYYHLSPAEADKVINDNYNSVEMIFDYFKRKSKMEGGLVEEIVEVEDIEDLNQISQEMAQKQMEKMSKKTKKISKKSKPSINTKKKTKI